MNSNKKFKAAIAAVSALAVLTGVGSTLAYLTDSETHTNTVTYGNVQIDLIESNWDDSASHVLVPGRSIAKNPTTENTGSEDQLVIMKVVMPYKANGQTANPSTGAISTADTPYYSLNFNTTDWTALTGNEAKDTSAHTITYLYGYKTKVAAAGTTNALFTTVTMNNFIDGEVTSSSDDIVVTAYAIQTEGLVAAAQPTTAELNTAYTLVTGQGTESTSREANTGGAKNLAGTALGG